MPVSYTHLKEKEDEAKSVAAEKARNIIALSIQRLSQDEAVERTVSVVTLPTEEMKGRIIGREGRNIKAIEQATGVDLIIDDTPETITVSVSYTHLDVYKRQPFTIITTLLSYFHSKLNCF